MAVTPTRDQVRALFSEACHGAGAPARMAARRRLQALAIEAGRDGAYELIQEHGLDLDAYWASCPISPTEG